MKLLQTCSVLGVLLAISACATAPIPVRLIGDPQSVTALAGDWTGDYDGLDSHRTGTISFTLRATDTTAVGEVVMIPREDDVRAPVVDRQVIIPTRTPRLLTIMFVRVAGGQVNGVLDPYDDPTCDCLVITTFLGRRTRDDVLEGTFETRIVGSATIQTGTWKVRRR